MADPRLLHPLNRPPPSLRSLYSFTEFEKLIYAASYASWYAREVAQHVDQGRGYPDSGYQVRAAEEAHTHAIDAVLALRAQVAGVDEF